MSASATALCAALAVAGYASWGVVEYGIHGLLSHRWKTFVSPLHWSHHRNPRGVFTAPLAWVPGFAVAYAALALCLGPLWAGAFVAGLLAGFLRYETVHWRIHFREPRSERERTLRSHHLAHHYVRPSAYHGVTTRRWDRVFGTLPESAAADYARVADFRPLEGRSNLGEIWNPVHALRIAREARRQGGEAPKA